jgi:hypothetical protein
METPIIAALMGVTGSLVAAWVNHRLTIARETKRTLPSNPKQRYRQESVQFIDRLAYDSKDFYSGGSALSTIFCVGIVEVVWRLATRFWPNCESAGWGLVFSFAIVLLYAVLIPEPKGYPNAGKFSLTREEITSGILNGFIVFFVILGLHRL